MAHIRRHMRLIISMRYNIGVPRGDGRGAISAGARDIKIDSFRSGRATRACIMKCIHTYKHTHTLAEILVVGDRMHAYLLGISYTQVYPFSLGIEPTHRPDRTGGLCADGRVRACVCVGAACNFREANESVANQRDPAHLYPIQYKMPSH